MVTPPKIQHHEQVPPEFKALGSVNNPFKKDDEYYFFKYKTTLVIFSGSDFQDKLTREKRYISYQTCFPMDALPWVMKILDYFFTPPKDGGLPAGKIATKDVVDGETLMFNRGMCVG